MKTTNDKIAKYYDLIYSELKPHALNDAEISLINFLVQPGSKILDVGGGTGRHAITLSKQKFLVTVVDTSVEMLAQLNIKKRFIENSNLVTKFPSINVINRDIYQIDIHDKFDLIILMWNTFNEIALTKNEAKRLLTYLKSVLNVSGKILINIDDASKVDPANFNFIIEKEDNNKRYELTWKTSEFDVATNTSRSLETLKIFEQSKQIEELTDYITQRYWTLEQIIELAKPVFKNIDQHKMRMSTELYIILS